MYVCRRHTSCQKSCLGQPWYILPGAVGVTLSAGQVLVQFIDRPGALKELTQARSDSSAAVAALEDWSPALRTQHTDGSHPNHLGAQVQAIWCLLRLSVLRTGVQGLIHPPVCFG